MGGIGGEPIGPSKGLGGGGAGSGGSDGNPDRCQLSFSTILFGPVPGVANQLSVGDVMRVTLTGPAFTQVGVFTSAGGQAGSIAGARQLPTLIACLQAGALYLADVVSVNGSNINIRVRNA